MEDVPEEYQEIIRLKRWAVDKNGNSYGSYGTAMDIDKSAYNQYLFRKMWHDKRISEETMLKLIPCFSSTLRNIAPEFRDKEYKASLQAMKEIEIGTVEDYKSHLKLYYGKK